MIEISGYTAEEIVEFVNCLTCPNLSSIPEVDCNNYQDCYKCLIEYYKLKVKVI